MSTLTLYTNIVDIMTLKIIPCLVADCVASTITTFRNQVKTNFYATKLKNPQDNKIVPYGIPANNMQRCLQYQGQSRGSLDMAQTWSVKETGLWQTLLVQHLEC